MQIEFSELDAESRNALAADQFAFIDSKGVRHLPIHDANHVRAAMARIGETKDSATGNLLSAAQRAAAMEKITAAAHRFGIHTSLSADEGAVGGPTLDDVHVDGPLGEGEKRAKKKSPALKALAQSIRAHFASGHVLGPVDFEKKYQQAIGMAGGSARAERQQESQTYTEGSAHFVGADGTGYRMFLPFQFGEWVQYMPKPGVFESDRYGTIAIDAQRNEEFVSRFNEGVYQTRIPVDAEHQTKLSGAYGWIEQMRLNPDRSVSAYVDWTPRGEKALSDNQFKYFSPEWYDRWTDPASGTLYENVAIGGALTTRPFFKESSLQPLVASEQGLKPVNPKEYEEMPEEAAAKQMTELQQKLDEAEARAKNFSEELATARKDADAAKQASEAKATEATRASEAKLAEATKAAEAKDAEAKQLAERVAAIEQADEVRQFTEIAKDFPGETATHVSILRSLPNDPIPTGKGDEKGPSLRDQYLATQRAAAEQIAKSVLFSAIGSTQRGEGQSEATQAVRQAAEAKVKASDGKVSMAKAMAESWTDESYAQYLAESGN